MFIYILTAGEYLMKNFNEESVEYQSILTQILEHTPVSEFLKLEDFMNICSLSKELDIMSKIKFNALRDNQLKNLQNPNHYKMIAAGNHTLLLNQYGSVYSFGCGEYGKLGHGSCANLNTPTKIKGLPYIKEVAVGSEHSLLLAEDGSVYSFGNGSRGQLGLGSYKVSAYKPNKIEGIPPVKHLAASGWATLLLMEDGTVYGCGNGSFGQLGLGTPMIPYAPKQIPGIFNIKEISAGQSHTLLLDQEGKVFSCGNWYCGQLGYEGSDQNTAYTPHMIENIPAIKQVAAGNDKTFLLAENGTVYSCGGTSLLLGHGKLEKDLYTPTQMPGIANVSQIAVGTSHMLLLTKDGSVYSFGKGDWGQLGHGENVDVSTPTKIEGIARILYIVASGHNSFLLAEDGNIYGFGAGHGKEEDVNKPKCIEGFHFVKSAFEDAEDKSLLSAFSLFDLESEDEKFEENDVLEEKPSRNILK